MRLHEDALIIRGVKPRITEVTSILYPRLPRCTWPVSLFSCLGSLARPRPLRPRSRNASVSGMPRTLGVFDSTYYLSSSISHATKDALVSTPPRRATPIRDDLLRRAPTMGIRGPPANLGARRCQRARSGTVIAIATAGYLR